MAKQNTTKKHIVTSFHNLAPELQEAVKQKYPLGFTEAMMRVDKPNGDFFYAVPFDTDEIAYMVKIDVKIDDNAQEDDDKDYYDDEIKGADEIQDDGTIISKKYVDYTVNTDERICDGFYYATTLKHLKRLLSHPEQLDKPAPVVNHDIE
jgi:hypothetical protein